MKDINKLAGQTLVYGLGTIVPRFMNYAVLTPFYTWIFNKSEYGIITELYAYMVFMLIVLTYGMETAFFRFAQKTGDSKKIFSTALLSILVSSALFLVFFNLFIDDIATVLKYQDQKMYLRLFAIILATDAITAIPFAKLRRENKALKFSIIKIINVVITIGLVFLFLKIEPSLREKGKSLLGNLYNPDLRVAYVFLANAIGSLSMLVLLFKDILSVQLRLDTGMWKQMMSYSVPLLISGLGGSINDALDKMILRRIVDSDTPLEVVGEYGASYKIAVLMALFIQMYRYAMEPYFFSRADKKDAREIYSYVMKYFVIYALILYLIINLYISGFQYIIAGSHLRGALAIVPIVSMGYLLFGIFVNLSIWYKVKDLTRYGAYLTIIGALVTILINLLLVPVYGYMASAWAHIACYSVMIAGSYMLSRKHYPINYPIKKILAYIMTGAGIVILVSYINYNNIFLELGVNTLIIAGFTGYAEYRDKAISVLFKKDI
ncbi:MAG: oligosaccharide flippase family protein [Bacteroidales bacterium]|nr:oligosaccharide flippase family protein [Bacteroidales bacterium]